MVVNIEKFIFRENEQKNFIEKGVYNSENFKKVLDFSINQQKDQAYILYREKNLRVSATGPSLR